MNIELPESKLFDERLMPLKVTFNNKKRSIQEEKLNPTCSDFLKTWEN